MVIPAMGTIGLISGNGVETNAVSVAFIDNEFPITGRTFKVVATADFNELDEVMLSASSGLKGYTGTTR